MDEALLSLKEVTKFFGTVKALDCLSLTIKSGEIFTLLGPSGCGKTTTLRLVAGLEEPDNGKIYYLDSPLVSIQEDIFVPPHKRNMGMVFQSYALWPNMTVFDNVAYPLRARRVPLRIIRKKVGNVLELVGLAGLENRMAPLLSGGQQQRVALARALVYEPPLLLLDEPFSNLDIKLREQMRVELRLLQKKLGIAVLFVTHDQVEALALSDRVAVMINGNIEQVGAPLEVYENPQTPFVRDFLGKTVVLRGKVDRWVSEGKIGIRMEGVPQVVYCQNHALTYGTIEQDIYVAIRPEDIVLKGYSQEGNEENLIEGVVETLLFVGDRYEARLQLGSGETILCFVPRGYRCKEGERMHLLLPADRISLWPRQENLKPR